MSKINRTTYHVLKATKQTTYYYIINNVGRIMLTVSNSLDGDRKFAYKVAKALNNGEKEERKKKKVKVVKA